MGLEAGTIIGGKYRLRKEIGAGGMGAVWSAVHDTLDRTVAIKFLRPSAEDAETAAARFVSEAKLAARVKHRFVVDVFDFGITEDGVYYMVQELLEGEELATCFDQGPAWQVRDAVQLISQCLNGLEAVHQAGIVHRDLKPENVFVMRDLEGRFPKVLDFGISKLSDGTPPRSNSVRPSARSIPGRVKQITSIGQTLGTPWYMSPEQLRGRRDLDVRADVYSMGVILYEWLTGRVPYEQDNLAELSLQVASGSAVPVVSLRPELGHEISAVIARALAPEREQRFASAAAMRDALLAILPQLPTAWTIVQRSKAAGPIGAKTELLLRAAAEHFGNEGPLRLSMTGLSGRIRPWMIGVGAVFAIALLSLPFLLRARPEIAAAKVHTASQPTAPKVNASPEPAKVPSVEEGAAPVALKPVTTAPTPNAAEATVPSGAAQRAGTAPRDPSRASTRERRASQRAPKKVIRTLDF